MPKFFLPAENIDGTNVIITGSDARHIKNSLRMKEGDRITAVDFSGHEYECIITSSSADRITSEITNVRTTRSEPPYAVHLYQAMPKGDKLETILQKAVETGVSTLTPFLSERCVSRPDVKAAQRKAERLQKIAREAAMQCGRGIIPQVMPMLEFGQAVTKAAGGDLRFICYEGEETVPIGVLLRSQKSMPKNIRFMIGSEGGFSSAEISAAKEAGLCTAGLGKRILRCETAPVFVLSCLAYEYELSRSRSEEQI